MEAWRAMEDSVRTGLVRQLGIANATSIGQLQAIHADATVKPAVVQQRIHAETCFEIEMRLWCAEARIYFQSCCDAIVKNKRLLDSERMTAMAKRYDVTNHVLFFRFLIELG